MNYVIWSFEHQAWWRPNQAGYTIHLELAGRYNATEAGAIVTGSIWLDEVAVPEPLATQRGAPTHHPYGGLVHTPQTNDATSHNVPSMLRTFRELYHDHSEHTAIEWLRDVFTELERESAERQRLSKRNHDLTQQLIHLSNTTDTPTNP